MLLTVKNPVANIYKKNNRNSEIVTQILLGEHFKCQKKIGNFFKGYKTYDKYKGFIKAKDLYLDKNKKPSRIVQFLKSKHFTMPACSDGSEFSNTRIRTPWRTAW